MKSSLIKIAAIVALVLPISVANATDTPQTTAQLQNALRDGQPAGSITPQIIRNLAVSVLNKEDGGTVTGPLNANGTGTSLAVQNNATVGGTLGVTGAATFGIGSGQAGVGLAVNNGLAPARITQNTTNTWSGSSTPNSASSPFFSSQSWSGYPNDGGQPDLNYFRVNSATLGQGDFAMRYWEDQSGGMGGRVALEATTGNDAFAGYTPPAWVTGTAYAIGQPVIVGYNIMYATSAGTSGAVTPTCSSTVNTCSDGTVSWKFLFIKAYSQTSVGMTTISNPTVSWGGTSSGPIGEIYGLNTLGTCQVGYNVYCIGYENDFGIPAGKSSETRVGEQLVIENGASVQGSIEDAGWRITSQGGGAAGLLNLMTWGSQTSATVIDPNGYGLQAYSQNGGGTTPTFMAGAGAIDMTEFSPSGTGNFGSGFILRGPGSQILGSGDVQSNYALLHKTTNGASLDVSEYHVTAVAVHAGGGGTNWTCTSKWARGSDGSIVSISAISGGAVTGVSLVQGAYATSPVATVTYTAEQPRNCGPISTTGSPMPPSTFQVDETWAQVNSGAPVLALGGTADAVVGTQTPLAAGATQGFLGLPISGAAPTGVPTNNAVGAMVEVNTASKSLNIYIPGVGWYHAALVAGAN